MLADVLYSLSATSCERRDRQTAAVSEIVGVPGPSMLSRPTVGSALRQYLHPNIKNYVQSLVSMIKPRFFHSALAKYSSDVPSQ